MELEVKVWILTVVVAVLGGVIAWVARVSIKSILERLDKLISQNNAFGKALIRQHGEINGLKDKVNRNEKRLNEHSERIRKIELNQPKN